jgi:hypothetical protein
MADQTASANTYSLPTALPHSSTSGGRKTWRTRLDFLSSSSSQNTPSNQDTQHDLRQENTRESTRSKYVPKWWKVRLFRGMINDVRRRAPFYVSDWVDAWNYRVVPATVYMYFAKYYCPSKYYTSKANG